MIAVHMIKRWHVFLDLLKFLLFFFSGYCVVTFATDVPKMWEVHTAMEDLFVDEEFEGASYKKNFNEIMTIEETWQWITGPLVNGLYAEEYPIGVDDNGDAVPLPPNKMGNILFFNRLVGGARLRQVRYADDGCRTRRYVDVPELKGKYDTKDGTCFKEWAKSSTSSHESDFIGYVYQYHFVVSQQNISVYIYFSGAHVCVIYF